MRTWSTLQDLKKNVFLLEKHIWIQCTTVINSDQQWSRHKNFLSQIEDLDGFSDLVILDSHGKSYVHLDHPCSVALETVASGLSDPRAILFSPRLSLRGALRSVSLGETWVATTQRWQSQATSKTRGWDGLLQINGFDISPLMGYKWVIDGL